MLETIGKTNYVIDCFFGMGIIANLRSAYYDRKEQLVIDAKTIAKYGN